MLPTDVELNYLILFTPPSTIGIATTFLAFFTRLKVSTQFERNWTICGHGAAQIVFGCENLRVASSRRRAVGAHKHGAMPIRAPN